MKRWSMFFREIGWPAWVVLLFALTFMLLPLLFNQRNIVEYRESGISFPVFTSASSLNGNSDKLLWRIPALMPYSPGSMDTSAQGFLPPFGFLKHDQRSSALIERHWLGTDLYGRDILVMVLYAARSSLLLAVAAALLSWIVGLILGTAAAYFTCFGWRWRLAQVMVGALSMVFAIIVSLMPLPISDRVIITIGGLCLILVSLMFENRFRRVSKRSLEVSKAIVFIYDRVVEFFTVVPRVVFVLVVLPLLTPSASAFVLILVLSSWVDMARIVRTETKRVLIAPFVESARMSGIDSWRLLWKHVLPNSWPSTLVHLMFSIASNIMIESGIEFMGFGWAKSSPGLGDLIAVGKHHLEAWWIVLFPGLLVACMVYSLFSFAERLQKQQYRE